MKADIAQLQAARDLIARPGGWTQGSYARDEHGNVLDFYDPNATCWCASGALRREGELFSPAFSFLSTATKGLSIVTWNDAPGRTQDEVVAAFDKAIELAKAAS